jgi:hypothetical protein
MLAVVGAELVKFTVQLALAVTEPAVREHGDPVMLPAVVEKLTVPVGVSGVPADEVSITVAVHIEV